MMKVIRKKNMNVSENIQNLSHHDILFSPGLRQRCTGRLVLLLVQQHLYILQQRSKDLLAGGLQIIQNISRISQVAEGYC